MKPKLIKSVIFVLVAVVALVLPTACEDDTICCRPLPGAVSMRNEAGEWETITKTSIKMPRSNNYMVLYFKSEGFRPEDITVFKGSPNLSIVLMDTIPDEILYAPLPEGQTTLNSYVQRVKITALTPWEKKRSIKFRVSTRSYTGWYSDFTLTQK